MSRRIWILPLAARDLVRAALVSLALALAFCAVLARYWQFYRLDTPWAGVGLLLVVFPAAFVGATAANLGATVALRRRRAPRGLASWSGSALAALALALLLGAEFRRTREARSGEGAGAGDLAPFLRSLVGVR